MTNSTFNQTSSMDTLDKQLSQLVVETCYHPRLSLERQKGRLYPMGSERYLPAGLQLTGLDECGNVFLNTQARRRDDYIQIKFSAEFGERFSLRISLDNAILTENLII